MRFVTRGIVAGLLLGVVAGVRSEAVGQQTAPTGVRVAFVNAQLVLRQMPGYAQAESTFAKEAQSGEGELTRLKAALDSAVAEYQQQQQMLSASNRTARERELGQKQQQLAQRQQEIQVQLQRRERELLEPMQERLTAVIEGMRAEANWAMVIDLGLEGLGIVTYDKSLDITDRVMQRLRQSN